MVPNPNDGAASHADLLRRIAVAARAAGRQPGDIALTAVSKQQPWEAITPILAAGQRVFGENRVREAVSRWEGRREGLELHLIGPLQTNKVREAVAFFDVIESLDRPRLAESLAKETAGMARPPRLYVQVNTGEEAQKAGVTPREVDGFIADCRERLKLAIAGLMCIPPADEPAGPHFALLAKIARRNGLTGLSMGMSGDFESAIAFGATAVRVGSALFGERSAHG